MSFNLTRRITAEFIGATLLAAVVIGSGIMGERLAGGNAGIALLANTAATAAILYVLITTLGPVSGAHFNPAVTLASALRGETSSGAAFLYAPAQVAGCVAGAMLAHAMFDLPLIQVGAHVRAGPAQWLSEGAATFALVASIRLSSRFKPKAVAGCVALTIAAGYWWTSSTSFANPAITLARAFSDTFAGIRLGDVPGFVAAQFAGGIAALILCDWLIAPLRVQAHQCAPEPKRSPDSC